MNKYLPLVWSFLGWTLLIFSFTACVEKPNFPFAPEIQFFSIERTNLNPNQDSVIFTITFKDGDGNLGIDNNTESVDTGRVDVQSDLEFPFNVDFPFARIIETAPNQYISNIFYHNVYIRPFRKKADNTFEEMVFSALPFHQIFPVLFEEGRTGPMEGTMIFRLPTLLANAGGIGTPAFRRNDVIKFKLQIVDRALNLSNIIETAEITLFVPN
jgi:hypothetical protein